MNTAYFHHVRIVRSWKSQTVMMIYEYQRSVFDNVMNRREMISEVLPHDLVLFRKIKQGVRGFSDDSYQKIIDPLEQAHFRAVS